MSAKKIFTISHHNGSMFERFVGTWLESRWTIADDGTVEKTDRYDPFAPPDDSTPLCEWSEPVEVTSRGQVPRILVEQLINYVNCRFPRCVARRLGYDCNFWRCISYHEDGTVWMELCDPWDRASDHFLEALKDTLLNLPCERVDRYRLKPVRF